MRPCVVVHYHEVGLKGPHRPFFLSTLEKNLRRATASLGVKEVERASGRILLWLEPDAPWERLRARIARVFGVVNFARGYALQPELETLVRGVVARLPEAGEFGTFAVRARRAFKELPLSSREIAIELGSAVQAASGAGVNLSAPDMTIYVEVLPQFALFFFDKERGPGGLPVGCSAPVTVLLSGGIDSPVAACRMLKRGSRTILVHFHSFPFLNSASQEKARELSKVIDGFQGDTVLYLVPLGEIQRRIVVACPAPYRVVLYRRFMVRIAEALGKRHGAQALVTGDSLGQVASQTIENLTAVEDAATQLYCVRSSAWISRRLPTKPSASARTQSRFSPTKTVARSSCPPTLPSTPISKAFGTPRRSWTWSRSCSRALRRRKWWSIGKETTSLLPCRRRVRCLYRVKHTQPVRLK